MEEIKVYRTRMARIIEWSCAILIIVPAAVTLLRGATENIASGLSTTIAIGFSVLICLIIAYHPTSDMVHIGFSWNHKSAAQVAIVSQMLRIVSLLIALMNPVCIAGILLNNENISKVGSSAIVVLIVSVLGMSAKKIRKAIQEEKAGTIM